MRNQAMKLMREREVLIAEALEVLSIVNYDMAKEVKVPTTNYIIKKGFVTEVIKTVNDIESIEALKQELKEKEYIIEEQNNVIADLKAQLNRQNIVVEKPVAEEEIINSNGCIEITCKDKHVLHGYYTPENDTKKTPFTCGVGTSSPIVYGKNMMTLSNTIGSILVNQGLVKDHKTNIKIKTMPVTIKGKEIEMLVYRDKTGALVGALEQRCTFIRKAGYDMPLVTKMKTFIYNGVHQVVTPDGVEPLMGYESIKTHSEYVHIIAAALVKFEEQEQTELDRLMSTENSGSALDAFNQQINTESNHVAKEDDFDEEAYFAKAAAMFNR